MCSISLHHRRDNFASLNVTVYIIGRSKQRNHTPFVFLSINFLQSSVIKGTNCLNIQISGMTDKLSSHSKAFLLNISEQFFTTLRILSGLVYAGGSPKDGLWFRSIFSVELFTRLRELTISPSSGLLLLAIVLSVVKGVRGRVRGLPLGPGSRSR